MKIYEYDKTLPLNVETIDLGCYLLVSFDAVYDPAIPQSKRVYVYVYKAKKAWMNLIFLHGIGNGNIPYLLWFAEYFKLHGINTFFMVLPYHERRGMHGWKGGEPFFSPSPSYCINRFHEAVKDVRRTIDYIDSISDLHTSIMGFSFGGMIAVMSLALDKRLKKGVLAFTGGDWRWINWHSPYTEELRKNYRLNGNEYGCRDENDCLKNRDAMKNLKKPDSLDDIFLLSPKCFHYDPCLYGMFVNQEILFFRGIFDRIIPLRSSEALFKSLPKVKKIVLPCGHRSSYFFRKFIANRVIKFLKNTPNPLI